MNSNRNPDLCENSGEQAMPVTNSNIGGVAPQATSTIGIPEPPPATIEATGAVGAVTVLNPFGPSNQLNQGAIVFAYPDLIYDQFIDVNQQIEITDDTSPGTLILQIPYHPISDYTNQYIQNYAALHGRYNGDILVRAQIIGNSTFSGTLIWFWYPTRYPNAIVDMSAAQKYSYKTQSVVLPSVEEFILKDARQYQYYRDMSDTDIASRPHLCLAVHTSVVSPLREGIRVRMRIGTRLASRTDFAMGKPVQPFMFADPQAVAYNPTPGVDNLNGRPLSTVFPHYAVNDLFMYADGISTLPSYSTIDSSGNEIPYSTRMPIPSLYGGMFPEAANQRCYTYYDSSTITSNEIRLVMVNHQFPTEVERSIATDTDFRDLPSKEAWLTEVLEATAIQRYVTIYVIRNNAASVNIYSSTSPSISLDMVQQTSCLSNYGQFTISCFTYSFPSFTTTATAIANFETCAVPNNAAGTPIQYPTNGVLGPVSFTQNLVALPATWVALKLSSKGVTIVSSNSDLAPTTLSETDLLHFFGNLSSGLTSDQCLQFDLVNPESRTRVATLRYLPSRRDFVINPISQVRYAAFNGSVVSLLIANYGIVPTASTFPTTDISVWSSRVASTPASLSSRMRRFMPFFKPNSASVRRVPTGTLFAAHESVDTVASHMHRVAPNPLSSGESVGKSMWDWGTGRTYYGSKSHGTQTTSSNRNSHTQTVVSTSSVATDATTRQRNAKLMASPETRSIGVGDGEVAEPPIWRDMLEDWGFEALKPMSLSTIFGMVNSPTTNYKPNAAAIGAVAAGALSSLIGSGINWAHDESILHDTESYQREQNEKNRAQAWDMQQSGFQNSKSLQNADIMNKQTMQSKDIANQRAMQQNSFGQQSRMQQADFQQQKDMADRTYGYSKDIVETGIAGNLLNTATGGMFSLATSAVNTMGSAYLSNQNYENQSKLITKKANADIQTSGAGAAALRLSSNR